VNTTLRSIQPFTATASIPCAAAHRKLITYNSEGKITEVDGVKVSRPIIQFALADPNRIVPLPITHSGGAAGFDLAPADDWTIEPGGTAIVGTGIRVSIPAGHVGLIRDRSSLHTNLLMTLAGVIDSDYTGEIKIVLHNFHPTLARSFHRGDRLAQLVVVPCLTAHKHVVDLDDTKRGDRGDRGFGSTG